VHEGEGAPLDVPLGAAWEILDSAPLATSATTLSDGRLAVDLLMLDSPHRLELILNPVAATFTATWPVIPLFMAGVQKHLADMKAPA
jgi:hypothetical protein